MSNFARQLEKNIKGKISKVAKGELAVKDSGLGKMIIRLKEVDEATAEILQKKYVSTVKKLNEDKNN